MLGGLPSEAAALDINSVTTILEKLSLDNVVLLKAKMERDIGIQVTLYSNPMSKRAIEHDMRLSDIVADLVDAVIFGGAIINATVHN